MARHRAGDVGKWCNVKAWQVDYAPLLTSMLFQQLQDGRVGPFHIIEVQEALVQMESRNAERALAVP